MERRKGEREMKERIEGGMKYIGEKVRREELA